MIQKSINSPSALLAISESAMPVGVFFAEFMAAFAVRFGALHIGMCFNGFCQRFFVPAIKGLFFARGPSAIIRGIRPVIVNAFKRVFVRRIAHIRKEVIKRIAPALANVNTAPAPILEVFALRVCASLDHVPPSPVHLLSGFHGVIVQQS